MRNFKELKVWEKAHLLTLDIYKITKTFPKEELYGLTSQLRRSCASITANIAESCGKSGRADIARYLEISMGSASELEYHLLLAHDLNLIITSVYNKLNDQVIELKKMLAAFIRKLRADY